MTEFDAKLTAKEMAALCTLVSEFLEANLPNGYDPKWDHYRSVSPETRLDFSTPEVCNCSLYDDITELKKHLQTTGRLFTNVDLDRFAALILMISQQSDRRFGNLPE